MGTIVSETKREASTANEIVKARPRASCPASPLPRAIGIKTARVVSVEAVMARPTSEAPILAASRRRLPSSK
ncbi:hypothetical protein ES703_04884 [subsurface metagenome]